MSAWIDLKHSELMPGQAVDLSTERLYRPRRAIFRFRTTMFAVFDVEVESPRLPNNDQQGYETKRMWFRLLSEGNLRDELLLRVWSIRGELVCGRAEPFDQNRTVGAHA